MKSKIYTSGVALVLFLLMLCKVSAFHVYTHQDEAANEIENCSVCDVALENQYSELHFPATYDSLQIIAFDTSSENNFTKKVLIYNGLRFSELYCRPPPSVV